MLTRKMSIVFLKAMYKYENTRYNIIDTELQYVPTQPRFKRKVQNPFLSNKVVEPRI